MSRNTPLFNVRGPTLDNTPNMRTQPFAPTFRTREGHTMPNYTVSASQLQEGQVILVKGQLVFSRLARVIDGDDLKASDARRVQQGMSPIGRPHTTLTLAHAEVVPADPSKPTLEETFVHERLYDSSTHPEHGKCFGIDNKSTQLPIVAQLDDAKKAHQITLTGELAGDVPVLVALRVYKPKAYANRGLALDQVIIQQSGPVPYYSGNVTADALAARGIVFDTPPVVPTSAPTPSSPATPNAPTADAGLPPMPAAAVQADPYLSAPVAQPVVQAVPAEVDEIAQMRAKLAAMEAAAAVAKPASAFGAAPAAAADTADPWATPGITYVPQAQ